MLTHPNFWTGIVVGLVLYYAYHRYMMRKSSGQ